METSLCLFILRRAALRKSRVGLTYRLHLLWRGGGRVTKSVRDAFSARFPQRAAQVMLFIYLYFLISYLWVYFGHQGKHPSELQILPYLTNQAFDVGCDQRRPSERLPKENASGPRCT